MLECFYILLKETLKVFENTKVYYSFVSDDISENVHYVVFSNIMTLPDYELSVFVSTYQVSIFSKDLKKAIEIRDAISLHFSDMKMMRGSLEICETSIESEKSEYSKEDKLHQEIIEIKILYKK